MDCLNLGSFKKSYGHLKHGFRVHFKRFESVLLHAAFVFQSIRASSVSLGSRTFNRSSVSRSGGVEATVSIGHCVLILGRVALIAIDGINVDSWSQLHLR